MGTNGQYAAMTRSDSETRQTILDLIVARIDDTDAPPTQQEIAEALRIAPHTVQYHLVVLRMYGYVFFLEREPESLVVIKPRYDR